MSEYIKKYKFEQHPKEISYLEGEPLKLTKEFAFYHNKSNFRKELTRLQDLLKEYLNALLLATGIRDSYLEEEITEKYLIVLFTDMRTHKKANEIIKPLVSTSINPGCFYLETRSEYMLLLAKDMDGLVSGIDTMETILKQTLEDYFKQKIFDDYIKIRPFKLLN